VNVDKKRLRASIVVGLVAVSALILLTWGIMKGEELPPAKSEPEKVAAIMNDVAVAHDIIGYKLNFTVAIPHSEGTDDDWLASLFYGFGQRMVGPFEQPSLEGVCFSGALVSAVSADGKMSDEQRATLDDYFHGLRESKAFGMAVLKADLPGSSNEDIVSSYDNGRKQGHEACR